MKLSVVACGIISNLFRGPQLKSEKQSNTSITCVYFSPNSLYVGVLAVVPSSRDPPKFVVRDCREVVRPTSANQSQPATATLTAAAQARAPSQGISGKGSEPRDPRQGFSVTGPQPRDVSQETSASLVLGVLRLSH